MVENNVANDDILIMCNQNLLSQCLLKWYAAEESGSVWERVNVDRCKDSYWTAVRRSYRPSIRRWRFFPCVLNLPLRYRNPPWPSGQLRGFGTGPSGSDTQSWPCVHDGVLLGKAHFIAQPSTGLFTQGSYISEFVVI